MPYIDKTQREKYKNLILQIQNLPEIETKGDLEFMVFALMQKYMKTRESRYSTLHDCTYAVSHCGDEFRRRFLDKREDHARKCNGDIEI